MRLAFISYEYPPDTAVGGIATYIEQAARLMVSRGHNVEVFSASLRSDRVHEENGILIHRVCEASRENFARRIAPVFQARHAVIPFDVIEGPEYYSDARAITSLVPEIPLVVKLHTPSYLIWRMSYGQSWVNNVRHFFGSRLRGTKPCWDPMSNFEWTHALDADEVTTPCASLGDVVTQDWNLDPKRTDLVPNPFVPPAAFLDLPATTGKIVTFIGRLEVRKGVLDFAAAIPAILRRHPDAQFKLVGRSVEIKPGVDMLEVLKRKLKNYSSAVEFTGSVEQDRLRSILALTDICVFPSIWENFPNVCLEAMAAGKAIVASSAGGMAEMLDNGTCGFLVKPRRPRELADAVNSLLDDPPLRQKLGHSARQRVLSEYSALRIGELMEESYHRAIVRRRNLGPRLGAKIQDRKSIHA